MECTDLMLDDWVLDTYTGKPMRVSCVNIKVGKGLEPIPITSEILAKNGFIEDEKSEYGNVYHLLVPTGFEKNSYTIQVTLYKEPICGVNVLFKCWGWIPPYNGGINDIHLCGIGFIHEMQHALRLCGINKEIVL